MEYPGYITSIFILMSLLILAQSNALAQDRIGFINFDKIIQQLPKYLEGNKGIALYKESLSDSIQSKNNDILGFITHVNEKHSIDSSQFLLINSELELLQKQYQQLVQEAEEKIKLMQAELNNSIRHILQQELIQYCTINSISTIFDEKEVWYCKDCEDFTSDFWAFLSLN